MDAIIAPGHILVTDADGDQKFIDAGKTIIATGARARTFPNLPVDGERVFHYRKAMALKSSRRACCVLVLAPSAWNLAIFTMPLGTEVHVVEMMDQVLPIEDAETADMLSVHSPRLVLTFIPVPRLKNLKLRKNQSPLP